MTKAEKLGDLSFEQAFTELESIVRQLEDGRGKLDEAIGAYERGVALKLHCETKLKAAQMKVEKVVAGPSGSLTTMPLTES